MIFFGVEHGMRGYYACVYDNDGPIQTGIGSYSDPAGALVEAIEWAIAEHYPREADKLRKELEKLLGKTKRDDFNF